MMGTLFIHLSLSTHQDPREVNVLFVKVLVAGHSKKSRAINVRLEEDFFFQGELSKLVGTPLKLRAFSRQFNGGLGDRTLGKVAVDLQVYAVSLLRGRKTCVTTPPLPIAGNGKVHLQLNWTPHNARAIAGSWLNGAMHNVDVAEASYDYEPPGYEHPSSCTAEMIK